MTLSLPRDLLTRAKQIAVAHDTSLSALLAGLIEEVRLRLPHQLGDAGVPRQASRLGRRLVISIRAPQQTGRASSPSTRSANDDSRHPPMPSSSSWMPRSMWAILRHPSSRSRATPRSRVAAISESTMHLHSDSTGLCIDRWGARLTALLFSALTMVAPQRVVTPDRGVFTRSGQVLVSPYYSISALPTTLRRARAARASTGPHRGPRGVLKRLAAETIADLWRTSVGPHRIPRNADDVSRCRPCHVQGNDGRHVVPTPRVPPEYGLKWLAQ